MARRRPFDDTVLQKLDLMRAVLEDLMENERDCPASPPRAKKELKEMQSLFESLAEDILDLTNVRRKSTLSRRPSARSSTQREPSFSEHYVMQLKSRR